MIRKWELIDGRILQVEQDLDIVNKEFGATVWDSALVLAKYLENEKVFPKGHFKGKTVLDIGSGTGFIGIILLIMGATVHFTDRQVLIPLIEKNIHLNCQIVHDDYNFLEEGSIDEKAPILASQYQAFEYLWGEPNPIIEQTHYDYVIICDCIYESKEMWLPLAKALNEQLHSKSHQIIVAHEKRSHKDLAFFPYIQETFQVERVPDELMDPVWRDENIRIFYLTFKGSDHDSKNEKDRNVNTITSTTKKEDSIAREGNSKTQH
ncbi:hypothetical protein C9374_001743 [Naegleria lovaniensis]|uniref:Uncharacterized protein n=1 Tax=Naegleria lovaniensis TaxID=51637 RepID=A0AA88GWW4_NAELO|nr:uncharacterized protein C9374_001743 [Naegleria lovaniensis]KAG2387411.1 hypothetical protein C9374_001743 [Naegleria lovaniensis]